MCLGLGLDRDVDTLLYYWSTDGQGLVRVRRLYLDLSYIIFIASLLRLAVSLIVIIPLVIFVLLVLLVVDLILHPALVFC